MEDDAYHQTVLAVLSKRYRLRVRQIRNRRKMTHQIMIQKYMQYMQASQHLFQTYAMKVLELFEPAATQKKSDKVTESWWVHQFPNLSDSKFLKTFHVSRKFYSYLCQQLADDLKPIPNKISNTLGTPVEKTVALGLYKLATGESYKKTSKMVGVNHSTVHKLLVKFLKAVLLRFGESINSPSQNECMELAQKTYETLNATDVIGTLLKKRFQTRTSSSAKEMHLLGIVDIERRIRFARTETAEIASTFCEDLKSLCCLPSSDLSLDGCPNYFIVADDKVPDYDYFVQKVPSDSAKMDQDLDDNVNRLLEIKEDAFRMLTERWGSLKKDLDYLPLMANLVLMSAVCLHNLCIDIGDPSFECDK